jgi:hypothetical protein
MVEKHEKIPLGRPTQTCVNNIKVDINKMECDNVSRAELAQV